MTAVRNMPASATILVIGRRVEVTESFRTQVTQKLADLTAFEDQSVTYTIELRHERNPRQSKVCCRVEIAVTGPGPTLRTEGSGQPAE